MTESLFRTSRRPYPVCSDAVPPANAVEAGFRIRFANGPDDFDAVTSLRGGEDQFDLVCHHLMAVHEATGVLAGTLRLQTSQMACRYRGFSSAAEFHLAGLPPHVVLNAVEFGRPRIRREYRSRRLLSAIWHGLDAYMTWNRSRFLFGCCPIPTAKPSEAWAVRRMLEDGGVWHPTLDLSTASAMECPITGNSVVTTPDLPLVFQAYLGFGAKVCGGPALDRAFGTTDFFVMLDRHDLVAAVHAA